MKIQFIRGRCGPRIRALSLAVFGLCLMAGNWLHAVPQDMRVGIVYSKNSEAFFSDAFIFRQLFTAVQSQTIQAGLPFDLLDESDLADFDKLAKYKVLVIPALQIADQAMVSIYKENLRKVLWENGVAIIAADAFFSYDANNIYQGIQTTDAMRDIFGLGTTVSGTYSNVTISSVGSTHPISTLIKSPEELAVYDNTFYQEYGQWVGLPTDPIAWFKHGTESRVAIQAAVRGNGKMVHFSDLYKMVDSKILWAAIQWASGPFFGPQNNVTLSMTRANGILLPRNDMDLSRFLASVRNVHFPLLDILKRWKQDYSFKGSFYINIGNDSQTGVYTDWDLSGPLYQEYISIGNEIGTHSYTHPQDTKLLDVPQLQFEFLDSKNEIATRLGFPVTGTGIPGEDENLFVYETINPWFDYISGHTLYSDSRIGANLGIGYLTPTEDTLYYSLNMTPDFVLGDILKFTPEQSSAEWQKELVEQATNMRQPVLHWLWHDYGIINSNNSPYYGLLAFEDLVKRAYNEGYEFATLHDYTERFKAFTQASFKVDYIASSRVVVDVSGSNLGALTVELGSTANIVSAGNHYAYNGGKLFLPANGGNFPLAIGSGAANVTRVTSLDSRLNLLTISGDGTALDFQVSGLGKAVIHFKTGTNSKFEVLTKGAVTYTETGAEVNFPLVGTYFIQVRPTDNIAPLAMDSIVSTAQSQPVTITLDAMDFDGFLANMVIVTPPTHGIATINKLLVEYTPNPGFVGTDTLVYKVSDEKGLTAQATVTIIVTPINLSDGDPFYNFMARTSILDGSDSEWEGLEKAVADPAEHTGTPNLLDYTDIYLAHNSTKFFVLYKSTQLAPLNWAHNAFIDSDGVSQTGFIIGSIGADILVQGGLAYKYIGTGLDWNWQQLFNIVLSQNGNTVEFGLDRSNFADATSIRLIFMGDNTAYTGGTERDLVPDDVFTSTTGFLTYNFFSETTNSVPIAQSAALAINQDEHIVINLKGIDLDGDPLIYNIVAGPSHGQLVGATPNVDYIPVAGYAGSDQFTFTVSDGKAVSQPATVSITINALPQSPTKLSNALTTPIVLDGNLADWSNLTPFPADPLDQDGAGNFIDWTRIRFAHTASNLYLAYSNESAIQFNWAYNIYVDTDLNKSTGFQPVYAFTGVGAEYLIQSEYVYKYSGTGLDWNWTFVGSAQSAIKGTDVELVLPRSLIGSPEEINVVGLGENVAYPNGTTSDLYPDDALTGGGVLNYFFGTAPGMLQSVEQAAGPVPPLVPYTIRIWYVMPDAINPNPVKIVSSPKAYTDIRVMARPNSNWSMIHSLDLKEWVTARSWQILGSYSEFAFPLQNGNPDGSYGFFEVVEQAPAPSAQ